MKRTAIAALVISCMGTHLAFAQCNGTGQGAGLGRGQGRQQSGRRAPAGCPYCNPDGDGTSTLTSAEIEGLKRLHEEEKVARDFYNFAAGQWDLETFRNIASAESRHFTQVGAMLSSHGVDDAVVINNPAGVFVNPEMQALYDQLKSAAIVSISSALNAAGYLEEQDIADLRQAITDTNAAEIDRLYGNLLAASENHLRAAARQLAYLDATYQAQVLSASDVAEILGSKSAPGKRGSRQGLRRRSKRGR